MSISLRQLQRVTAIFVASLLLAACAGAGAASNATTGNETVKVERGTLRVNVNGSGTVQPEQSAALNFGSNGTVDKVLVKEGQAVKKGDILATLDSSDLDQQVLQMEANLETAQARLEQAKTGNAKEEDKRAAKAGIDIAKAQLEKAKTGNVTQADIDAAQAQINQAQAQLRKVQQGGTQADIDAAQAQVNQAKAQLRKARQNGTQADIDAAQAQVDQAQAQLRKVKQGGTQADIDAAQAQVNQAKAQLRKLQQGGTPADIAAAQAQVNQAQAQYDKLVTPATPSDIEIAQAAVRQAQAQLEAAKLNRDKTTLKAPFDGVVTAVNVSSGDTVGAAAANAPITMVDARQRHVDVSIAESDVAQVQPEQLAQVTLDALGSEPITGTVTYIAPSATVVQNVTTYTIRVALPQDNPAIRVGMSASVAIGVAEKKDVLLIPSSAVRTEGNKHIVRLKTGSSGKTDTFVDTQIRTGLANDVQTEVVSGLKEGDVIAALGVQPVKG